MKCSLSRAVELLLKLGSCLAACVGCSSKNPSVPEQPHVIRWKGQLTGYEDKTSVRPADKAAGTGQK
ncbi:MAG: hypothetical protein K8T91_05850 [Planctomycetes bacterium]|nr:hypothetical protein [Planctomycetota bacterium]